MQQSDAIKQEPMGVEELLVHLKAITDRAVLGVRQAMASYGADLYELDRDPRYKALEAAQKPIVRAIIEAEMLRFAEEAQAV